jgi:Na+-driven multidrug efflux pump
MIFITIFHIFDTTQGVSCGVMRGIGKVLTCSILSFISYYIIAIPLEYILCFQCDLGL